MYGSGVDLTHYGTLILINSSVIGYNSYCGLTCRDGSSLIMYDSYLDVDATLTGKIEAYGSEMFYDHRENWVTFEECEALIDGLVLDRGDENPYDQDRDPLFEVGNRYNSEMNYITLENCHISSVNTLASGSSCVIDLFNCSLEGSNQLTYSSGSYSNSIRIGRMENTTLTGIDGFELAVNTMINCTFTDCDSLIINPDVIDGNISSVSSQDYGGSRTNAARSTGNHCDFSV